MCLTRVSIALFGILLGDTIPALTQMELSTGGAWSTFRGGKIGELTVLAFPDNVVLDVTMNDAFRAGLRVTVNSWEYFGHEASYSYQRCSFRYTVSPKNPASLQTNRSTNGEGFGVHSLYYNFVAHAARQNSSVRPFVTAGAGGSSKSGDRYYGLNFGGGMKFRLSDYYGFRLDIRDYVTGKLKDFGGAVNPMLNLARPAPGLMHNVEYSAGFSLLF